MTAIIISLIALSLCIILSIIKTVKPEVMKLIYIILIGVSIILFWILSTNYLDYVDNSYGFRTAAGSSGRWFLFAIPAFIIIGVTELFAKIIFIVQDTYYKSRPEYKEELEKAKKILKMTDEEFIEYMENKKMNED